MFQQKLRLNSINVEQDDVKIIQKEDKMIKYRVSFCTWCRDLQSGCHEIMEFHAASSGGSVNQSRNNKMWLCKIDILIFFSGHDLGLLNRISLFMGSDNLITTVLRMKTNKASASRNVIIKFWKF